MKGVYGRPDTHIPDLTPLTKEKLIKQKQLQQQHEYEIELHSNPILPDDIDEYGNLPKLRCGWTKCGKIFTSKQPLLDHVKQCIPHIFVGRFHLNCKYIMYKH